ncbi:hypothetical protein HD600_001173 [Microbacterium ginsengiterrae]|uniref:HNH nuclease domain-containing protein n=1 Tax=Microbacterium ginsengiterrae TaxID=546115 RepID=A0A7W9FAW8_9MICO|nr:HNH endonuclease signature motif containing protein [Microbacterium ginsengiterrae]MBB5742676.1 hypothetical protein [Microbacterium ginsengiterrae]
MTSLAEQLESIDRRLADVLGASDDARGEADADLLAAVQVLGRIRRRLDGAVSAAAGRVAERDRPLERAARFSSRAGCRDAVDLLRRALRVDGHTARRYATAGAAIRQELDVTSGGLLPSAFPALAGALEDGELSVEGFLACAVPLQKSVRIGAADRLAADALLARFARGLELDDTIADTDIANHPDLDASDARPGPAPTTDELSGVTAHILARIDPDGAEPDDRAGLRRRHLTIGALRAGTVPVRGELLPEVAAQLQKLIDSLTNPRVDKESGPGGLVHFRPSEPGIYDGVEAGKDADGEARADGIPSHRAEAPPAETADLRNHAQRRHDALATVLTIAAASGDLPALGGAAPTLVVSVRADDFVGRAGRATIDGPGYDVPLGVADHAACAGLVQRVLFDEDGAIVAIGTTGRIFNAHQRRAIILRDKKCVIPGCEIRAEWCEIHHVHDHALGGPTHTSNGVPLCWHHHRTLDTGAWQIRMRDGTPQIRGPHWWDPYGLWRAPHHDYRAVDTAIDAVIGAALSG